MNYISLSIITFLISLGLIFFFSTKFHRKKGNNNKTPTDLNCNKSKNIEIDISNLKNGKDKSQHKNTYLGKERLEALETLETFEVKLEYTQKEKNKPQKDNQNNYVGSNVKIPDLEKEILRSKEEIEDFRDEISDLENRIKSLKKEKNESDDNIYNLEKDNKEGREINLKNEAKLIKFKKENTIQKETLDFASDILNANNATNEQFTERDHKIGDIIFFIENDLKPQLSKLENYFIDDLFISKCWSWRNQEIKSWIKNKKVIAIVGEFSAGKTSIVNRILKQDDPNAIELPVNSIETTAIPTYISQGIDFNCQFYSPSGDLKNISSTSFQKVTKSILDDINISSIVKYFVLSYKNEYLSNISILDTPGFGSVTKKIIDKTTEVVKEADALFWVVDAHTGELNTSSVDVLKNNLAGIPLYIIINKSDDKSPKDLDDVKTQVEKTLNINNIDYQQVIFFSNQMKADGLISLLNSISTKENPDVISELNSQIKMTLNEARNRLDQLKMEENVVCNDNDIQLKNLQDLKLNIHRSIRDMGRVFDIEKPFFGKEYYKMSTPQYRKFDAYKNKVLKSNENLPSYIDNLIQTQNLHFNKKEKVNSMKRDIQNLEQLRVKFEILIVDYAQIQNKGISKTIIK